VSGKGLHHIFDVSHGEDASQIRTSNGPQVMATLRNLAIAILKLTGARNIAAAAPRPRRHPDPGRLKLSPP
jgi:hypothetical protein